MRRFYLGSPRGQLQAHLLVNTDILISFTNANKIIWDFQHIFDHILVDCGAYTEFNTGVKVEFEAYKDWAESWRERADAIAGLDDIHGDYKKSWNNFQKADWMFPTWHDTDPIEYLDDL